MLFPFQAIASATFAAMTSTQFAATMVFLATIALSPLIAQAPSPAPTGEVPVKKEAEVKEKIELKKPETAEEAEAKRLADEAEKKKMQEEQAQRDLAAKKEAEEAARRKAEAEKTFFTKLLENSKLYTGVNAGLGLSLSKVHSSGYTLGMTIDYLAYGTYGLHFSALTGQYPAKAYTMSSNGTPYDVIAGGSFGILAFDLAAVYALPTIWQLEPAVGLGLSLYQLRGGGYDFNQTLSPLVYGSVYYNLMSHLQVGLITQLTIASASKLEAGSATASLDSSIGLTTLTLQLSVRYSWF